MKRVYFVEAGNGNRRLSELDFPLSVGGSDADVVLLETLTYQVVAHIAVSDGHAYLQPAKANPELFHNHNHISESVWLKSGDRVQLGDRVLCWEVKGDQVFIKVREVIEPPELKPPVLPPDAASKAPTQEPEPESTSVATHADPAVLSTAKYRKLRYFIIGLFSLLSLVALFVVLATPLEVRISPQPENMKIDGFFPVVSFGQKKLVVPGSYTVGATRAGYQPMEEVIEVVSGGFSQFELEMQELPGQLKILVNPDVPFTLYSDDSEVIVDAQGVALLKRGPQQLIFETDRYLAETLEIDIKGYGERQKVSVLLQPAWAVVQLESQPAGATVTVDGQNVGMTPLSAEVLQGQRNIEFFLTGYKRAALSINVIAGISVQADVVELMPNDGKLILATQPGGATVSVDGRYYGSAPIDLVLTSGADHQLRISLAGYETMQRSINLMPDEERQLSVDLKAEFGVVFASSIPADASLSVDGKPAGIGVQRLRLTTRQHLLTFSKPGYQSQTVKITPGVSSSQNVDIKLKTESQVKLEARAAILRSAGGQELHLLEPSGSFEMGASRREAGRRANESRRLVEISKPFYLSVNEITNAEYGLFDPKHTSGSAEGMSLNNANHPVVNISWNDAARFCNWLSEKDKLPVAYVEADGKMKLIQPATNGYRLPSEAEWVYAARVVGRAGVARYPWGDGYPPKTVVGNFADAQIADTLANVVAGYNDGYRASAPVGSFAKQNSGDQFSDFNDLGGNVAEWINDFYAIYPGQAERLVKDPTGPPAGEHHVVRGSSWRDGSITELRLSYRDYSRGSRDDLGFRIARYADE